MIISPTGVLRGLDGVRANFTQLLADLPNASWDLKTQIYKGDVLFPGMGGGRRVHPDG